MLHRTRDKRLGKVAQVLLQYSRPADACIDQLHVLSGDEPDSTHPGFVPIPSLFGYSRAVTRLTSVVCHDSLSWLSFKISVHLIREPSPLKLKPYTLIHLAMLLKWLFLGYKHVIMYISALNTLTGQFTTNRPNFEKYHNLNRPIQRAIQHVHQNSLHHTFFWKKAYITLVFKKRINFYVKFRKFKWSAPSLQLYIWWVGMLFREMEIQILCQKMPLQLRKDLSLLPCPDKSV